ncbi:uncharacterized protein LOC126564190 [Anopheles maculipalpis]|uniref:uncharacterized protein LOC126564190 n=1 Tax=Anopheles maculipalpis TaxID=1496333 RepID=UPI002159242A|nr:uncharacterized protein LOC126564190 [Anopheles maculipalpis]
MDPNSLLSMNLALNVARKCRICGMDILDLTCAFPIFGNDRLDQKIERYLQLNIQIDDLLPKCICGSCYLKLESIDQFSLMAHRTEEAFRSWLGRLRGLNCPAETAKNVNVMLPLYRPDPEIIDTKKGAILCPPKSVQNVSAPTTITSNPPASSSPPDKGIISYSDLKLGLLIKDQELLKLILKALKWAENDRRASFEVLIQRLKNSSFREILSNRNLLNDSDLTQLLKSYIGQGVMNSFASAPAGSSVPLNNNVPPTVLLQPNVLDQANPGNEYFTEPNKMKLIHQAPSAASGTVGAGVINVNEYRIDEANVTQMEVGVDPDLYLPYEDEDSSSATKFEARLDDRQDNTVTIKLVTTNVAGDMIENKRMIPAILNVRSNKRFQCSACPECFETNGELQQHIVRQHLPRTNRTVMTEQGKPAIKIRVRKNKLTPISNSPTTSTFSVPSPPALPLESTGSTSPSTIKIVPLKIPASTTITIVPAAPSQVNPIKSVEDQKLANSTTIEKIPPIVASPKGDPLVRKSKRKSSVKLDVSSLLQTKKQKKLKAQTDEQPTTSQPKSSRKANASFCTLCRKKLTARESLRDHMQQEHSRYECEKCDRSFKSALTLSRHQQYHASVSGTNTSSIMQSKGTIQRTPISKPPEQEQTYKCNYCVKAFKRSHHLKLHLKHHTKDATVAHPLEEKPTTGNGLRKRTKHNRADETNSAISSVLHASETTSTRTRKMVEASKRKSTINRRVRFSC